MQSRQDLFQNLYSADMENIKSFRRELLNCYVFGSLSDYNHYCPHEALDNLSPIEFLQRHNQNKKLSA
jgi:putative transposase